VVAGKDAAEMAGEVVEQAEFGGRGGHGLTANGENHGGGIDGDVADLEWTGRQGALEAAKHGFDAGDEFAGTEGLGDVVVGADFKAEDAVGLAAFGGEKNDGNAGEAGGLADGAAKLEAVAAGDHDIEDEKRGTLALGIRNDVRAGGIDADDEAIVLQMMANEARDIRIVFDDEDAWFHENIVAGAMAGT